MKLDFEQIKSITLGAVKVEKQGQYVCFHRFTEAQEKLYSDPEKPRTTVALSKVKSLTSAGVKLCFKTNSKNLTISARFSNGMNRRYYSMDVYCNHARLGYISNLSQLPQPEDIIGEIVAQEKTESFSLPNGENEICVYFPFSAITELKEVVIDDGASIVPVKPEKNLLAFGDSITHGYDAFHSADSYINRLADLIGYQLYNKAIGGEIFFPELALAKDDFTPDLITIAYGTNDWRNLTIDKITKNCDAFLNNLTKGYPNAKIVVISPIWRQDMQTTMPGGDFYSVGRAIEEETKKYLNVRFVNGFGFIPQDPLLYADRCLHPNDQGFLFYAENLYKELVKFL